MKKPNQYTFVVDDVKAKDLSLERLAKYLEQFARLLGQPQSVHFKELREGSSVMLAEVDEDYRWEAYDRTRSVKNGRNQNKEVATTLERIDALLVEDNSTGSIRVPGRISPVIEFSGVKRPKEDNPIVEEIGSIQGEMYELGGKDDTINIGLRTAGYGDVRATAQKAVAMDLKLLLWKMVRLTGTGKWERTKSGWRPRSFVVDKFEELSDESLVSVTKRVREFSGELWSTDNPIGELENLREGD